MKDFFVALRRFTFEENFFKEQKQNQNKVSRKRPFSVFGSKQVRVFQKCFGRVGSFFSDRNPKKSGSHFSNCSSRKKLKKVPRFFPFRGCAIRQRRPYCRRCLTRARFSSVRAPTPSRLFRQRENIESADKDLAGEEDIGAGGEFLFCRHGAEHLWNR